MTTENKTIIEINGVKLEVDLRNAKRIENFKIGDAVKILVKDYETYTPYLGMIVGFDEFEKHPTIIVSYLKKSYKEASFEYAYINSASGEKYELCAINEWDIPFTKQNLIDCFDKEILSLEESLRNAESKKKCFLQFFGKYFDEIIK